MASALHAQLIKINKIQSDEEAVSVVRVLMKAGARLPRVLTQSLRRSAGAWETAVFKEIPKEMIPSEWTASGSDSD